MTKIHEKAVLVKFSAGQFWSQKYDRKVTKNTTEAHKADAKAGRFYKNILQSNELTNYTKNIDLARGYLWQVTMPWDDGGIRLLPAKKQWDFNLEMNKYRDKSEMYRDRFLEEYNSCKEQAARMLGDMYDPTDYPPIEHVRGRFYFDVLYQPVPSSGDFRVDVGDDIKDLLDQQIAARSEAALQDLWGRVYEKVAHVHERLSDPDKTFRGTLFDNLGDLVEMIPEMNFEDDDNLNRMCKDIGMYARQYNVETVKKDKKVREAMATRANDIMERMSGYMKM